MVFPLPQTPEVPTLIQFGHTGSEWPMEWHSFGDSCERCSQYRLWAAGATLPIQLVDYDEDPR
jgi:hypothetical protein